MTWSWQQRDAVGYSIFTTEFDVEISGAKLGGMLAPGARALWQEQIRAFDRATELERTRTGLNGLAAVDKVLGRHPEIAATTAVSVLVDHSGSLRGQKAMIACLLALLVGDFVERLGVKFEILGFTTAAWRGGRSRKLWISRGLPANPGRLNDLLHIRYREASDRYPGAPWTIYHLLRSGLLKENVDGEALLWASERLKNLNAARNVILVVSDGAPVDDSSLAENGPRFLWDHLKAVIEDLVATPGFSLAGIGIDHDVASLYPAALKVDRLDQIAERLPGFLAGLFD